MMFEKSLIQKIIDVWNSDQNNPSRGRYQKPILELSTISKLVEIAFIASLEKEEDKLLHSVCLYSTRICQKK